MTDREPLVVLGAGLAGLSLTDALLDLDPGMRIVLLDRRRRWSRDRTWCTWLTGPLRFAELAGHRWSRWELARGGHRVVKTSRAHPYIHLESRDLYARVRARIAEAPRAQLRAGVAVRAVQRERGEWIVETDAGRLTARRVVDAMGPHSPLGPPDRGGVQQRFVGWEIESGADAFDPTLATLMDFRGHDDGAVTFFYVLPFSTRRALIEHTTIGGPGPSTAARRDAITDEADRRCGSGRWQRRFEERGLIPMSAAPRPLLHGPDFYVAGAAAGCIRASSGYAFSRTQQQVQRLAAVLVRGSGPPPRITPPRYALLDRMFLETIGHTGDHGERLLWNMARRTDGDRFARFMTDASSLADDLRVAATLPALR